MGACKILAATVGASAIIGRVRPADGAAGGLMTDPVPLYDPDVPSERSVITREAGIASLDGAVDVTAPQKQAALTAARLPHCCSVDAGASISKARRPCSLITSDPIGGGKKGGVMPRVFVLALF